mgnify:CR=1 FL=1
MKTQVSKLHHYNPLWRVPVTWRTTYSWDRVKLTPVMQRILRHAAQTGILDEASRTTTRALEARGLCNEGRLTREGRVVAISLCDLQKQCELLVLPLNVWCLTKARKPELAVMTAMSQSQSSCRVAYCEGGAIMLLLYCLCFERLYQLGKKHWGNAQVAQSFMYTSIMCYSYLLDEHPDLPELMVADIANTEEQAMIRAFDILKNWQGSRDGWAFQDWVGVDREFVQELFRALGNARCAAIARRFLEDPYAYSKGWPDLVWVDDSRIGLIEVKTIDRFRPSQIITIPEMREVADLQVEVTRVRWRDAG